MKLKLNSYRFDTKQDLVWTAAGSLETATRQEVFHRILTKGVERWAVYQCTKDYYSEGMAVKFILVTILFNRPRHRIFSHLTM